MDYTTKSVWVAWTNSDRAEGRGRRVAMHVCRIKATAIRLGRKGGVQGSDCDVSEEKAVRIKNGPWLIPGEIKEPSEEDFAEQERADIKSAAIEKAKAAGLSDDDIKAIGV